MKNGRKTGKVYLIGAGPGDPGLLTLRGRECLEACDAVYFDYLANPELLNWTKPEAEKNCLGKHGVGKLWSQAEINRAMIEAVQQGKVVARLKGGDPLIFGRAGEEIEALVQADIPFEIVPGITAALGAASYAGLSLTHRDHASCIAFVTGARKNGENDFSDFIQLAKFPGTLVVYMGTTTVREWSQVLVEHGLGAQTPVLIVRHATETKQLTAQCELGNVANVVAGPPRLRPPALFVIGPVAATVGPANWFVQRPLFGQRVLVTRPSHQNQVVAKQLARLGAQVVQCPMVQVKTCEPSVVINEALERLQRYRWIVFTSANGVTGFFEHLNRLGRDPRVLGPVKIAAVGRATQNKLKQMQLFADFVPGSFRGRDLADGLAQRTQESEAILLVRGSRSRESVQQCLRQANRTFDELVVYDVSDTQQADSDITRQLHSGELDWVTLTSPAIAKNFLQRYEASVNKTKFATISPATSEVLMEAGITPAAEASEYTFDGLVDAMVHFATPSE